MKNEISEEAVRKKAIKSYSSLHANFHLSSDETFLTSPPAVLNTDAMKVYDSSEVDYLLNKNLVFAIEKKSLCYRRNEIKKIHRVIQFKQLRQMKPYIDLKQ